MSEQLTLGSLFDGIGGFPLAGIYAGMKPVWASEIEPFPIRVTTKRLPFLKHLGDIHALNGGEIEPVDVITFGSPCQNLSVASAKRTGLQGEQSSLFFEAVRVIAEMRKKTNGMYPKWAVWENVPGALSSAAGHDFRQVLESLVRIKDPEAVVPMPDEKWLSSGEIMGDAFSLAWRMLDAQYFGVPQRRRRIFLVVDFDGQRAGEVLFESESLSGDHQPGEAAREGIATDAPGSVGGSGDTGTSAYQNTGRGWWNQSDIGETLRTPRGGDSTKANLVVERTGVVFPNVASSLCARADSSPCVDRGQPFVAMFSGGQGEKARSIGYSEKAAPTLKSAPSGGNTVPDVVYSLQGNGIDRPITAGCNGKGWNDKTMYTLNTIDRPAVCYQDTVGTLCAVDWHGVNSQYVNQDKVIVMPTVYDARGNGDGNVSPTLTGDHQRTVSDYTAVCVGDGRLNQISMTHQSGTLDCSHTQKAVLLNGKPPRRYIVRRLLPCECCRLQGYPDGWTENLGTESPTKDEIDWWSDVFLTAQKAQGKNAKPRSRNIITRWLKDPRSDAAEYKAYGNSVAVPCVHFVLSGIAWATGIAPLDEGGE